MKLLKTNKQRIKQHIKNFSKFGKTSDNGVTRLALTKNDKRARDHFCNYCENLGLKINIDDLGNVYATLPGLEEHSPIVIGSHLDTVENGGRYDGALGVIAGLEVVEILIKNNITPKYPITIVNFTNEEGVRFAPAMMSSGVLAGKFKKEDIYKVKDRNNITFLEALTEIDYLGSIKNRLEDAKAFIELHIEQGPILDENSKSIGIVDGVVGMTCYEIDIIGESNHAGTTPMYLRDDALFTANTLISNLYNKLSNLDNQLVYTVGRFNVSPNLHTVIPRKVSFTIEARHHCTQVINKAKDIIESTIKSKHLELKNIRGREVWGRKTVWFDSQLCNLVKKTTQQLNYSYDNIISGAGHDAQFIADYIPTTMIFVPSVDGKSHTASEFTPIEDIRKGVNVLLNTVLSLINEK